MTNTATAQPGLALPKETFAKLTPVPFLRAHLKSNVRPSGRRLDEFRSPAVNRGSLTHANGSAVVRVGDTAVVCGVRGEILLTSDMPNPPKEGTTDGDLVEKYGLVVPNVELSTGCSPAHLPGNAPSAQAQSLTYRIQSILQRVVHPEDLQIEYEQPPLEDEDEGSAPRKVVKAYWTLYVDILCMALDGNAIDAICLAAVAALQDTTLPKAWWDADRESILCSPNAADGGQLRLQSVPITSTFAVFTTASPLKPQEQSQSWILADPDAFEESCCHETVTVILHRPLSLDGPLRMRLEKSGGSFVDKELMRQCVQAAQSHGLQLGPLLGGAK